MDPPIIGWEMPMQGTGLSTVCAGRCRKGLMATDLNPNASLGFEKDEPPQKQA